MGYDVSGLCKASAAGGNKLFWALHQDYQSASRGDKMTSSVRPGVGSEMEGQAQPRQTGDSRRRMSRAYMTKGPF